ncbi:SAM-dependent methyltransferase [Mycobacterium vulneris]|uniref:site-specific DNA-methyltransferase (adenine-specific) n=1 Tax=Mycolicibacterium vulneris TaxID=547163 RepID=A0A1X2LDK2_9MYCO|nr:DNA methyltransferase [Mycolicibacterium vulneris]OSC32058.1 SAM-dependent methyltransferase [Mycolicibacterium vulneris]
MPRLSLKAVEERVAPLGSRESYDREFIFDLLLAYGKPKGNVTRLRNGSINVAVDPKHEVAQKNVVYFRETVDEPLADIEELRTAPAVIRYNPRFVIVTDYHELVAVDTKTGENKVFPLRDIDKHFTFFLPWAGMEKAQYTSEAHADVKAAERMGKLFDALVTANPDLLNHPHGRHALNVFFTRLLFCYFADDTGIFDDGQFSSAVGSHTHVDGSDVAEFLTDLFNALDTERPEHKPSYLSGFPYVNGRLFEVSGRHVVPAFTKSARDLLLDLGALNWSEINPDIFGSMFQAIVVPGKRSDLGQHYTSVPNILKTIEPLFLDGLKEQFDAGFENVKKLEVLLERIGRIKVFDPACGSGNFLVIAYKELRRLEHAILERLADLSVKHQVLYAVSKINIENFYGIEVDDFAVEVAILSLWIAKHQMNREFQEKFGVEIPLIPLKETGQIRAGNATRVDWDGVCPNDGRSEIYLISNPPYVGSSMQTDEQKDDFNAVFGSRFFSKNLDYISLWFIKGAAYIAGTQAQLAFVTTNSVAQGEHVSLLFPALFATGVEIGFAYTSFKWENNAKRNAGVTVSVISLRNPSSSPKYIFTDGLQIEAKNINGYLADAANVIAGRQMRPISKSFPPMAFGSKPTDGGNLILEPSEAKILLNEFPSAGEIIKRYVGAADYIQDTERYCLWITDANADEAARIPPIADRLRMVTEFRRRSKAQSTVDFADRAHRFKQVAYKPTDSIIVPRVSSERREYIPMGYLNKDTVINDQAFAVYDAEPWLFGLLTSRMHMVWTRAVGGKLKTDYRYSNTIVYNNFPVPSLSDAVKERLTVAALRVLDVREYHCEKTLAELYDPDNMPADLRAAHAEVDALVDSIYSARGYETDEERLSDLFARYEAMTADEQAAKPGKGARK